MGKVESRNQPIRRTRRGRWKLEDRRSRSHLPSSNSHLRYPTRTRTRRRGKSEMWKVESRNQLSALRAGFLFSKFPNFQMNVAMTPESQDRKIDDRNMICR